MILFNSDYTEGAHPRIIQKLVETNFEQTIGYGEDKYCKEAQNFIKKVCGNAQVKVHFLVGGTQTNTTVIASVLRPHQGVVSADSGHINTHEAGAIEATGHKVLALPGSNGKLSAIQIEETYRMHREDEAFEHIVQPKMVYISHPTELGTLYTKEELLAIRKVCDNCGLVLFLDGARLGYGLAAPGSDVTLELLTKICDVFYIGGTKVGALFGEAVVICNPDMQTDFRYMIKQKGGMLAKGRLLGLQFGELFKDGLYFEISKHAVDLSITIKEAFLKKGYRMFADGEANQQFFIIDNKKLKELQKKYEFALWSKYDEQQSVIRICTSWATRSEDVEDLIRDI